MNKKILFSVIAFVCATFHTYAQVVETVPVVEQTPVEAQTMEVATQAQAEVQQNTLQIRYGKVSYNEILKQMPEYKAAKAHLADLRKKYEAEANYNESSFKRMFAEFLQGQKDFPQNIMLKRQRDLQDAMEKGLAYRHEADSLLRQAELDFQKPLRERLDRAIYLVGTQRGYECIFNIDTNSAPFLHPMITEDATPFVLEKLKALKP